MTFEHFTRALQTQSVLWGWSAWAFCGWRSTATQCCSVNCNVNTLLKSYSLVTKRSLVLCSWSQPLNELVVIVCSAPTSLSACIWSWKQKQPLVHTCCLHRDHGQTSTSMVLVSFPGQPPITFQYSQRWTRAIWQPKGHQNIPGRISWIYIQYFHVMTWATVTWFLVGRRLFSPKLSRSVGKFDFR